jgi:hypothetical protein
MFFAEINSPFLNGFKIIIWVSYKMQISDLFKDIEDIIYL